MGVKSLKTLKIVLLIVILLLSLEFSLAQETYYSGWGSKYGAPLYDLSQEIMVSYQHNIIGSTVPFTMQQGKLNCFLTVKQVSSKDALVEILADKYQYIRFNISETQKIKVYDEYIKITLDATRDNDQIDFTLQGLKEPVIQEIKLPEQPKEQPIEQPKEIEKPKEEIIKQPIETTKQPPEPSLTIKISIILILIAIIFIIIKSETHYKTDSKRER